MKSSNCPIPSPLLIDISKHSSETKSGSSFDSKKQTDDIKKLQDLLAKKEKISNGLSKLIQSNHSKPLVHGKELPLIKADKILASDAQLVTTNCSFDKINTPFEGLVDEKKLFSDNKLGRKGHESYSKTFPELVISKSIPEDDKQSPTTIHKLDALTVFIPSNNAVNPDAHESSSPSKIHSLLSNAGYSAEGSVVDGKESSPR